MDIGTQIETVERELAEFRREIAATSPDAIDLLAVERRAQELTNAYGRVLMREVMARADTSAPEVTIDGEQWGNGRETRATYTTVFGDIEMGAAPLRRREAA